MHRRSYKTQGPGVTWHSESFDWKAVGDIRSWLGWLWGTNSPRNYRVFLLQSWDDQYNLLAVHDPVGVVGDTLLALPGITEVNSADEFPDPSRVASRYLSVSGL